MEKATYNGGSKVPKIINVPIGKSELTKEAEGPGPSFCTDRIKLLMDEKLHTSIGTGGKSDYMHDGGGYCFSDLGL
jgi:hypothetical protein